MVAGPLLVTLFIGAPNNAARDGGKETGIRS